MVDLPVRMTVKKFRRNLHKALSLRFRASLVIAPESLTTRWRRNSLTGFLVPYNYVTPAISAIATTGSHSSVLKDECVGWESDCQMTCKKTVKIHATVKYATLTPCCDCQNLAIVFTNSYLQNSILWLILNCKATGSFISFTGLTDTTILEFQPR